VLVAPAGSLKLLRDMGYRTFENVIDSSYDSITNNTLRWAAVYDLIKQLKNQNLQKIFDQCRSDIEHNQKVFSSCGTQRLKALYKSLQS
jgi:site-specific recombinase